ncbi:hypothetical protein KY290_008053 [Solanum tuberosum]|uniref:Uncharacterized protein n=1 Tax=Solanum tuberosum TaxID=4113 RepID=A0ABQ7WA01_SOLTU|nr:hypothetical protein KY290_008053 [Solanum tuberosum]
MRTRARLKSLDEKGHMTTQRFISDQSGDLVKHYIKEIETTTSKDGNLPNLATIFFETRKKDNKIFEPETIEKHVGLAQLEEMVQADPYLA